MTGQATFSLEDDDLAGGCRRVSDFLAAGLSADPLPLAADSLEGWPEDDSPDCLSLAAAAAELEPFRLSVR